jgi:chitinase
MRFKTLSVFILLILFTLTAQADKNNQGFKVIGYYSLRSAMNGFHRFPFKMVTHVNLFFLNPDTTGNFTSDFSALGPFVRKAHRKHVKVLFSIAGGSEHPYYHRLMQDGNRSLMVRGLVEQVLKYDLDGIDVDIEGNDIDNNYEAFVVELADSLKSRGKIITSAIAVYSKDKLSDRALAQYDFVNIMVYDRTGPWRPDKPGPHSTYENAVEDLEIKWFSECPSMAMVLVRSLHPLPKR